MSLARRALMRKQAGAAFDFEAARAARQAQTEAAQAAAAESAAGDEGLEFDVTAAPSARRFTLAQRHRMRAEAGALAPANDNTPIVREATGPYELQLYSLAEDRRSLKALQSREAKIALKRDLLPKYDAWVEGVLNATGETGQGVQDEVLVTCMIWRLDVGDWQEAIKLAGYVLHFKLQLPERFTRTPACLIAEEVADAALAALSAGGEFPLEPLAWTVDLVAGHDMPDEVRAKLHKAVGLELKRAAGVAEDNDDGPAGGRKAKLAAALEHLQRAVQLNPAVGVKKQIEALERELKKESTDDPGQ